MRPRITALFGAQLGLKPPRVAAMPLVSKRPFLIIPTADTSKYTAAIFQHPWIQALQAKGFQQISHVLYESEDQLAGSLTGDTLSGNNMIAPFPVIFSRLGYDQHRGTTASSSNIGPDRNELYAFLHLGTRLNGHPGIVHGGFLATLLDEALYRCCYPLIIQKNPKHFGVTANLNVNYRAPAFQDQYVVVKAKMNRVDGSKYYIDGAIETLSFDYEHDKPTLLVEATQLIIVPKWLDEQGRKI